MLGQLLWHAVWQHRFILNRHMPVAHTRHIWIHATGSMSVYTQSLALTALAVLMVTASNYRRLDGLSN